MRFDLFERAKPHRDYESQLCGVRPSAFDPGRLRSDYQEREGSGAKRLAPERLIPQQLSRKRLRRGRCSVNLEGEHMLHIGPDNAKQGVRDDTFANAAEEFDVALPPFDDR